VGIHTVGPTGPGGSVRTHPAIPPRGSDLKKKPGLDQPYPPPHSVGLEGKHRIKITYLRIHSHTSVSSFGCGRTQHMQPMHGEGVAALHVGWDWHSNTTVRRADGVQTKSWPAQKKLDSALFEKYLEKKPNKSSRVFSSFGCGGTQHVQCIHGEAYCVMVRAMVWEAATGLRKDGK